MSVRAILCDLDGVLYVGDDAIPGAASALAALDTQGVGVRFVTNTTRTSTEAVAARLSRMGLPVARERIVSAVTAGGLHLADRGYTRCRLVVADDVREDLAAFEAGGAIDAVLDPRPQAVVLGDIGRAWDYDLLNRVFGDVIAGADLVALHKGRYWKEPEGLRLDIGAFVAGIEYATGAAAFVVGKPSPEFFRLALDALGVPPEEALMVGDDVLSDVGGAQAAGIRGVLVRTGKARPEDERREDIRPDGVIDSIADLPELLREWGG
jgi:HAD superfamily hydrolase (TIGR01458 family)